MSVSADGFGKVGGADDGLKRSRRNLYGLRLAGIPWCPLLEDASRLRIDGRGIASKAFVELQNESLVDALELVQLYIVSMVLRRGPCTVGATVRSPMDVSAFQRLCDT